MPPPGLLCDVNLHWLSNRLPWRTETVPEAKLTSADFNLAVPNKTNLLTSNHIHLMLAIKPHIHPFNGHYVLFGENYFGENLLFYFQYSYL